MAHKKDLLESFLPVVRYYGLKTEKNVSITGTLTLTGAFTHAGNLGVTGTITGTSASASALTVGANGATNPVVQVDASTASVATGVKVTGAAAAGGVAIAAISSGTNESLTIDAKGSGNVTIGSVSTGTVNVVPVLRAASATTVTAGGAQMMGWGSATSRGMFVGSGAPTVAAAQGSVYSRTDGSSTSTRLYVNTDGATTWTNVVTAA
jgi:hypothetical protein